MSLVDIERLSIDFRGHSAVDDLSLQIKDGERFGIIGESGSGKSVTALAIAGLLPDTADVSGDIRFDGHPLPRDEVDLAQLRGKRIGMVFQEPMTALNPLMRVGAQIGEAMKLAGLPEGATTIAALLAEVGLTAEHARRYPHQLSGGQRQRVMIAMALASDPDLLIADEPTSALDAITQRMVLDLIAQACDRRGMTLLFISHDIKAVAALCDRIAVMRAGKLVESAPARDLLSAPQQIYTQSLLAAARFEGQSAAPLAPAAELLQVEALSRHYHHGPFWNRSAQVVRAVNAVRLEVMEGECLALVGPSGCGKTTLARMIAGLDTATSGQMRFDGTPYHGADLPKNRRGDISLVFQDPFGSFDPRRTMGDSVGEPLRLLPDLSPLARRERIEETVRAVGLDPKTLGRHPHEFSGGQRQRFAIARALVTRPRLVVLDEPVSALDVSVRGEVLALLSRLQAEFGLTYLLISHDLDMVAAMAHRVLVMEAGEIVEQGEPRGLFADPQHSLTRALVAARLPDAA